MTADHRDLYAILGLTPVATGDQITHAYRVLLRRHHPDTREVADPTQGAASDDALAQIIAAYAVLRDPIRRAGYDRDRHVEHDRSVADGHRSDEGRRSGARPSQPVGRRSAGARVPPIVAGPVYWSPPQPR